MWTGGFLRATEGRSTHFDYPEYVCYLVLRFTKLKGVNRMKIAYRVPLFLHVPYTYYHTHTHTCEHTHTQSVDFIKLLKSV